MSADQIRQVIMKILCRIAPDNDLTALKDEKGCGKSKAYDLIAKAEQDGVISQCAGDKTYRVA